MNKPDHSDTFKNFGMNKWNDSWFEGEEDIELDEVINPMEGTVEEANAETKAKFYDNI